MSHTTSDVAGEDLLMKSVSNYPPICYEFPRHLALSAWIQHVPFGMYMVELLRPATLVELGTRKGVSYCAFCQALTRLGIQADCIAVDSWEGDAHTGAYGPAVLDHLRKHHDPLYSGFSHLHRATFDAAAAEVANGSIDLLHIDGLHTYEAVRHDFQTWLPKLSHRAVVLFHDIAERDRDFGVWRLWLELSAQYPSFSFTHGHGLGVLGVGNRLPAAVREFLALDGAQAAAARRFFHFRGSVTMLRTALLLAARFPSRLVARLIAAARRRMYSEAPGA